MAKQRFILLSFDVEEFDLPLEYGKIISTEEQLQTGKKGLDAISGILSNNYIETTLFTTAFFAQHYADVIRSLAAKHEIASHTFHHSLFKTTDLYDSRIALQQITGKKITGLRMPRMQPVAAANISAAGYTYDSSLNPTFIPGRYNHLSKPRIVFNEDGLTRIPSSVTPHLRIPLFWLCFKNTPDFLFRQWAIQTLKHDGYINLYFHPWEFTDIKKIDKIPGYVKNVCGDQLLEKLHCLIKNLRSEGEFISIQRFLDK
jgi:peptidoglycan/xylan/chitin deacetylase (PgdA/CDA1 family)